MREGKLRIRLLSDLCVSDGGVYNSALDTDICQDEYGFPYIPGKRVRGCLREAAIELNDWGEAIVPEDLFGKEGKNISKVFIGNAYPENYATMRQTVSGVKNRIFHKQNILNHYSYIRTQTAINYDTGSADPTSLRTMRVAKKGLVFEAPVQYEEDYRNQLERCTRILRHMGIARTRGLGEVEVSLIDECIEPAKTEEHVEFKEGSTGLEYTISLIDAVVFKSINGGEANTQDYIEGSRILGIIAEYLKKKGKDYLSFSEQGELRASHAFFCQNGKRYTETPATFYSIKNNYVEYRDKLYENDEHRSEDRELQLNPMKHGYIYLDKETGNLERVNVLVEERYHHRRPSDKAIGRAIPEDSDSTFYQISSICADQKFKGFITGSPEQIKTVYDCLTSPGEFRMGAGRSSEYGRVTIHVDDVYKAQESELLDVKAFAVKLVSPAIVYSEKAFYSVDSKDLIEEIGVLFGFTPSAANIRRFIKYTSLGGWNVTWEKRKPVVQAFDKGSVIVFEFEQSTKIRKQDNLFIGERRSEGFGELEFIEVSKEDHYRGKLKKDKETLSEDIVDVQTSDFAEAIAKDTFLQFMRAEASSAATQYFKRKSDDKKATVSDLNLMLKEVSKDSGESVLARIQTESDDRYGDKDGGKKEKKGIADTILNNVSECCNEIQKKFMNVYNITNFRYDRNMMEAEFLLAYLTFGKYIMHKNDRKMSREEEAANVQ